MTYLLLIAGFFLLTRGAGWLVDGASSLARKFKISDLVIGLSVVAFGTSAPEMFVNLFAAVNGTTEIAIGNIIGSNIANIMLILGCAALIYPLKVTSGTVWKEIPLSLLAVLLLMIMGNDITLDGLSPNQLSRSEGLVLIAFFVIFLYYTFGGAKGIDEKSPARSSEHPLLKSAGFILAGLVSLVIGGQWIVNGAVEIARNFGLSETLIGLTIIAVGTSLPELATSVVAAYKKSPDIAIGNVVGSNIFNIFWILGITATITPLSLVASANFDLAIAGLASALLFLWMFTGRKMELERWEGGLLVSLYIGYIILIVMRG